MVDVVEQRDEEQQQQQQQQQHQQQQQQQHDTSATAVVDLNVKKENIIPSEKSETDEKIRKIAKPETGENNQRSSLVRSEQKQIFSSQQKILVLHAPFVLATRSNRF